MSKHRNTRFDSLPWFRRIALICGFIFLCFFGLIKTLIEGFFYLLDKLLSCACPPFWRAIHERRKGESFEDYSEQRLIDASSALLQKDLLGLAGERVVFETIRKNSRRRIIACNAVNYYCELDLVYLDKTSGEIVFVEVKTRRKENLIHPVQESVDSKRRKKMALAARLFVSERCYRRYKRRYDIAVVIWEDNTEPKITFIENAFTESQALQDYQGNDIGKNRGRTFE